MTILETYQPDIIALARLTLYGKSVGASVVLALAVLQLAAISVALGWVGSAGPRLRGRAEIWHRVGGYAAMATIFLVAYNCLFVIEAGTRTGRVALHSVLGATVVGLVTAKSTIRRGFPQHYRVLPWLGGLLFVAIIGLWLSSAGWYFWKTSG